MTCVFFCQDMTVIWNKKLKTTAGITRTRLTVKKNTLGEIVDEPIYSATVELSDKVVDNMDRLRQTLAHELCHAGAWLIDHSTHLTFGFYNY